MAPLGLLILQKLEIQQNWNSPHGISGFADSAKTGNSTKLELHHMASLDSLFSKNRKSAKLEFHNMVSLELPFLWTSILIKTA